jgi:membrane protein YqaA with SNARE-associated domain
MNEYLILFAVVFAINLLPAFGPPTWSVIVLFGINSNLPLPGLVLTAAAASSSGRYLLAHGFRLFASRLSEKTRTNLAAARAAFERQRHSALLALAFFAVSPLPSAQQFGAVGLAGVRILPFMLAFFVGRLVSYTFYAGSAQFVVNHTDLGDVVRETLTSPISIAIQVAMLAGLVALAKVDWVKLLGPPPNDDST